MTALEDAIVGVAASTTEEVVSRIAAAVAGGSPGAGLAAKLERIVGTPHNAQVVELHDAWRDEPAVEATVLASSLRVAARSAAESRASYAVDLAWTGPRTDGLEAWESRRALRHVVESASTRLLLVTFAATDISELTDVLRDRLRAGVQLTMLIETAEDAARRFGLDGEDVHGALREHGDVRFYRWPTELRPGGASMHAKVAVADSSSMLITSANLTERGLADNMELGVLIRGGPLPGRFALHVEGLIKSEQIVPHLH